MKYFTILLLSISLFFAGCNFNTEPQKEKQTPPMAIGVQEDYPCYSDTIPMDQVDIDSVEVVSLKEFQGSGLYHKHCSMCHGNTGRGEGVVARHNPDLCPRDLTKVDKPEQCVYYIILNGQNKMPGQKDLTEEEVWVLIIYVKKMKKD